MRHRLISLVALAGFTWVAGCGDNSTSTAVIDRPELIEVLPSDFMGLVPCDDDGLQGDAGARGTGAARSYVATLYDVTPVNGVTPKPGFPLPSSPATPCSQPVTFSFVLPNHRYRAEVDAYTSSALSLSSLAPGARSQLDPSGDRVSPDWQANCTGYPLSSSHADGGVTELADGTSGEGGAAGASDETRGVVSYTSSTQAPHDCGAGLRPVAP